MSFMVTQLVGFGARSGVETQFTRAAETIITDMVTGASANIANNFDGNTNQAIAAGAGVLKYRQSADGYCGIDFGAGIAYPIGKVICYGSNDAGFVFGFNPSTTLRLFGNNSAPANGEDGTALGTVAFTDTANESAGRTITSTDTGTAYRYVWVFIDSGDSTGSTHFAEMQFFIMV
jgi:hypothetical protein